MVESIAYEAGKFMRSLIIGVFNSFGNGYSLKSFEDGNDLIWKYYYGISVEGKIGGDIGSREATYKVISIVQIRESTQRWTQRRGNVLERPKETFGWG